MQNGTIISEYTPGAAPLPSNFPYRNRIISGLSQGVLLVEAREKSGALITGSTALDQNRQVFAIPGRPTDKNAVGCNKLIQAGAKMVLDTNDITEELGLPGIDTANQKLTLLNSLTPEEQSIYHLSKDNPCHIDMLTQKLPQIHPGQISLFLLKLEMKKIIKRLPGEFFISVK